MDFFSAMDIVASGLKVERTHLNVTASNLANVETTRTPEGGPYKRKDPVFTADQRFSFEDRLDASIHGVQISEIREDTRPPRQVYDPGHPDADERGIVDMPNVNMLEEMVNMITASRAYEAGITTMKSIRSMAHRALSIGR